jgi:hypothetical protein
VGVKRKEERWSDPAEGWMSSVPGHVIPIELIELIELQGPVEEEDIVGIASCK